MFPNSPRGGAPSRGNKQARQRGGQCFQFFAPVATLAQDHRRHRVESPPPATTNSLVHSPDQQVLQHSPPLAPLSVIVQRVAQLDNRRPLRTRDHLQAQSVSCAVQTQREVDGRRVVGEAADQEGGRADRGDRDLGRSEAEEALVLGWWERGKEGGREGGREGRREGGKGGGIKKEGDDQKPQEKGKEREKRLVY